MRKFVSMILCMAMVFGLFAGLTVTGYAAVNHTWAETKAWLESNAKEQTKFNLNGDQYPGECVDLIQAYYKYLTGNFNGVSGHANQYDTNKVPAGFTRIKGATPQPGDVVVSNDGEHGHVWIKGEGNVSYHSSYLSHKYMEKVIGKLSFSVWGVIRPTFPDAPEPSNVPQHATTQTVAPGRYNLENVGTGYTFNFGYNWSGLSYKPMIMSKADGSSEQIFQLKHNGSGKYSLTYTVNGGGAVNVERGSGTAQAGDAISGRTYSGSDYQQFYITPVSGGYVLQSVQDPSLVIAPPSTEWHEMLQLVTYAEGDKKQIWTLRSLDGPTSYSITVTSSGNGTASANKTAAAKGETITLTAAPASGYHFKAWQSADVSISGNAFTMPDKNVSVTAVFEKNAELPADGDCGGNPSVCPSAVYTDVAGYGNWAHAGIDFCISRGLMNGISANTFDPKGSMTRAMVVTVLWRQANSPKPTKAATFDDLVQDWYRDAVTWAAEKGVVNGMSETKFGPNDPVTREQMAAILQRYTANVLNKSTSKATDISTYPDYIAVSSFAVTPMAWANAEGLITGTSSNGMTLLNPKAGATREQVATILMRFVKTIA